MQTIDLAPSLPASDKAVIYYTILNAGTTEECWDFAGCSPYDEPYSDIKVLVDKHEVIPVAPEQLNAIYAERAQAALANQNK